MTKYIVVRCRGSWHRVYEDVFKVAIARRKRKAPPIPPYLPKEKV